MASGTHLEWRVGLWRLGFGYCSFVQVERRLEEALQWVEFGFGSVVVRFWRRFLLRGTMEGRGGFVGNEGFAVFILGLFWRLGKEEGLLWVWGLLAMEQLLWALIFLKAFAFLRHCQSFSWFVLGFQNFLIHLLFLLFFNHNCFLWFLNMCKRLFNYLCFGKSLSLLDSSYFSLIDHSLSLLLNLRLKLFLILNGWVRRAEVMMLVEGHKIAFFCWLFFEFVLLVALILCEVRRNDDVLALLFVMDVVESVTASVGGSLSVFL